MWQDFVDNNQNSTILHDPRFIQIIEQVYKCQAMPQIINTEQGPCGIPAFKVHSLLSGRKITSMPFNFYPSLLGVENDLEAFLHLVELAKELGKNFYVEYKTFNNLPIDSLYGEPIFKTSSSIVSVLTLKEKYAEQQAGYKKSRRQDVRRTRRRARERGFQFAKANDLSEVREFYDLLSRLYRDKHHMISHPRITFEQIYHLLVPLDLADFYLALFEKTVQAGIVVLKKNNHWEYSWAASSEQYQELGLNAILVDWAIQEAIAARAKTLGFGSSSPNDENLLFFKGSWGCKHRPIYYYYWNHEPHPVDLETSFLIVRRFLPYIPLWLIRSIVPYLVPQLA
ncbi:GNAT family N-acetyltransferase [Chloroflexota bacterium]